MDIRKLIENTIDETILFWKIDPKISNKYVLEELEIKNVPTIVRHHIFRTLQAAMPANLESKIAWNWSNTNIYDQIIYLEELADELEIYQDICIQSNFKKTSDLSDNYITIVIYQILLDHLLELIKNLESIYK